MPLKQVQSKSTSRKNKKNPTRGYYSITKCSGVYKGQSVASEFAYRQTEYAIVTKENKSETYNIVSIRRTTQKMCR